VFFFLFGAGGFLVTPKLIDRFINDGVAWVVLAFQMAPVQGLLTLIGALVGYFLAVGSRPFLSPASRHQYSDDLNGSESTFVLLWLGLSAACSLSSPIDDYYAFLRIGGLFSRGVGSAKSTTKGTKERLRH
jgi:hypothetical protein